MKTTTTDIRNKVIYQIFTRNYGDGTFKAIEADLDRIKELGVDYIYLLPVHPTGEVHRKGKMGSPYAIKDYREIDPVQGTLNDLMSLSKAVHERDMKLIADIVYNHTSPDSFLAQHYPECFYKKPDGSFGNRIGDWWDVIDLDYSHVELWEYQADTLVQLSEFFDGFRCDVAPMVPISFWAYARDKVEEAHPGCLWIAESVEPEFIASNRQAGITTASDGELYQVFDICYDYDIYKYMKGAMMGTTPLAEYLERLNAQEAIYPGNYAKLRCLENHDRPRAAALSPDPKVLLNWTAFLFFMKGPTMLYAGQEFVNTHHPTLFDHDPVSFDTGKDMTPFIKKLVEIKKKPLYNKSAFEAKAIGKNDEVIFATHTLTADVADKLSNDFAKKAVGIFSTTGNAESLMVDLADGIYTNAINGRKIDVFEGTMSFDGNPVIIEI